MTSDKIALIIRNIEQHYASYKDGGREFIMQLSNKLKNTVDEDRNDVLSFFLREIQNNSYGLRDVALLTITEMKDSEVCSDILFIYEDQQYLQDEQWRYSVITTLMKIGYIPPKHIYSQFIKSYIRNNPGGVNVYSLLIYYSNVDVYNGILLLSQYFCSSILDEEELKNSIRFLLSVSKDYSKSFIPRLIEAVHSIDTQYGIIFEKLVYGI